MELTSDAAAASAAAEQDITYDFNTMDHSRWLELSKDRREIKYIGKAAHADDVGCILTLQPLDGSVDVAYYEVRVVSAAPRCSVTVGLADPGFGRTRAPGCDAKSFGYAGETGRRQHQGEQHEYAARYSAGDVVGCGVIWPRREIFFTLNGRMVGVAFRSITTTHLYPTIAVHSHAEAVRLLAPSEHRFDLAALRAQERRLFAAEVAAVPLPTLDLASVISCFLARHGHVATLLAMVGGDETLLSPALRAALPAVRRRARVIDRIRAGAVDQAVQLAQEHFSDVVAKDPAVSVLLHAQGYIEAIRAGDVAAAVQIAQSHLHQSDPDAVLGIRNTRLHSLMALIAYPDPSTSPVAYLLSQKQRAWCANAWNQRVVAAAGSDAPPAVLQRLMQHVLLTRGLLRQAHGDKGRVFTLADDV